MFYLFLLICEFTSLSLLVFYTHTIFFSTQHHHQVSGHCIKGVILYLKKKNRKETQMFLSQSYEMCVWFIERINCIFILIIVEFKLIIRR